MGKEGGASGLRGLFGTDTKSNLHPFKPPIPMPISVVGGLRKQGLRPNVGDYPCLGPHPSPELILHGLFFSTFLFTSSHLLMFASQSVSAVLKV